MARGPRKSTRSRTLAAGIGNLGRHNAYVRSGRWALKKRNKSAPQKKDETATKAKAPRFYPADDVRPKLPTNNVNNAPKTRSSLVPGAVLIVLSGPYRGKRVVLLRVLESGLLLITGPRKINGVPLRRVNPAYVIGTSTKVDISGVKVDAKFNDAYFARPAQKKSKGDELFDSGNKEKNTVSDERKADQKSIDTQVLAAVAKVPALKKYLNARFSLTNGQYPHELQF
eukprot:TRINITY_DN28395_c0_g1_i1.p1 TRINITY_DN28395_c0_g1~~TRINITY_DN28395_c0_g1_i1.p1  ORF type:complete len:241 (-),score=72.07 TRINITY_DN28395_c0_g1_i1:184-864(-)